MLWAPLAPSVPGGVQGGLGPPPVRNIIRDLTPRLYGISLPEKFIFSLPLKWLNIISNERIKVVIFIPPAVEAGHGSVGWRSTPLTRSER